MKRIVIAFLLILLCLTASMTEVFFISRNVTSYCDDIERIDTSMRKDDFENALNLCADINDHWNEMAWMVDALLIHDYVDGVGLSLAQMQRYIENGSPDLYFAESEKAKRALASLKDSEYPTTENIF